MHNHCLCRIGPGLVFSAAVAVVLLTTGFRFVLQGPSGPSAIDVTAAPYFAVPNDGQDDSSAFQAALNDLAERGRESLYIPNGGYRFDQVVAVTNNDWGLMIQGESADVRLYSNNSNGIFRLIHTGRKEEITIRDLSMIADFPGAGTAIEITSPPGGVNNKRIVTIENIYIRFYGETNYFNQGIAVTGVYRPLIKNSVFSGPVAPLDISDGSLTFSAGAGFNVSDCYAPVLEGCRASGVETAYYFSTQTNSYPEDGAFRNCVADYCKTGIYFQMGNTSREPTLWVTDCDIRARDYGVWIYGRRILHLTGNTLRQLSSAYALRDICLENCHLGVVLNNTFPGGLEGDRKNVTVASDGLDLLFAENSWSGTEADSVEVNTSAEDIIIY